MKTVNYEEVTDKSVWEVKLYLLERSAGVYQMELLEIVDSYFDTGYLKKAINKRHDIQLWLFTQIKKAIDQAKDYDEMEQHFIMMNLIIDKNFPPLKDFKFNMFYHILKRQDVTLETYCLMRHLISFKYSKLDAFIKMMTSYKHISEYDYHHISSEILLLERQYKKAYEHLPYVEFDKPLYRFKNFLYNYSPRKYEALIQEPTFNTVLLLG